MRSFNKIISIFMSAALVCSFADGCGKETGSAGSYTAPSSSSSSDTTVSDSTSTAKGSRDNTPSVLVPSADGETVYSCDVATIDASNITDGYLMVDYSGSNEKVKLQITGPDSVTQTYNLHGGYEVFPLTGGDGSYNVGVFECVDAAENRYATVLSQDISVTVDNIYGPYLYPNQYVNFTADSLPVAKGEDLAYSASSDLDVVTNVYNYIIDNITYDYDKAKTVASGYIPDVDEIYQINTGICFDYAAVMGSMLRSQGIPTRLEVGYMGDQYHAWISVHTEETGWINGIIEFDGDTWRLMDPTFASTSKSPKKFTTDDDGYLIKYIY